MEFFEHIAPYFLPVFAITYFLTEVYRAFHYAEKQRINL